MTLWHISGICLLLAVLSLTLRDAGWRAAPLLGLAGDFFQFSVFHFVHLSMIKMFL